MPKKIAIIISIILLVIILMWVAYFMLGRPLINSAYHGESLDILNNLVKGQSHHAVEYYFDKAEYILTNISALLMFIAIFYLFFLFIDDEKIKNIPRFVIPLILLLFTLLLRLPYFFPPWVGHWDESIFILMGREVYEGNLPYVNLLDQKQPLTYYLFALFFTLFGKSITAVRIGGGAFIFLSAWIMFEIGKKLSNKTAGFWGAVLFIIYSTVIDRSGVMTLTEHLAILPLSIVLLFLLCYQLSPKNVFLIGLTAAGAFLIRANMLCLMPPILLVIIFAKAITIKEKAKLILMFFIGFAIPNLFFVLLYFINGQLDILYRGAILYPYLFTRAESLTLFTKMSAAFRNIYGNLILRNQILLILFIGGTILALIKPRIIHGQRRHIWVILLFFSFIFLSIIETGKPYPHYLIQIVPLTCLISGIFLVYLYQTKGKILIYLIVVSLLISNFAYIINNYDLVLEKVKNGRISDIAYSISDYLNSQGVSGEEVFIPGLVICYFLTDTKVPTVFANPRHIIDPDFQEVAGSGRKSPISEIQCVFAKEPRFVVCRCNAPRSATPDPNSQEGNKIIDEQIKENYELAKQIEYICIYKRKTKK